MHICWRTEKFCILFLYIILYVFLHKPTDILISEITVTFTILSIESDLFRNVNFGKFACDKARKEPI